MSENVVSLRGDARELPGINQTVVAKLEGYLEQARRGEIDGIALALSRPNGCTTTDFYLGPQTATFRVVAAAAMLQHDICVAMQELSTDPTEEPT